MPKGMALSHVMRREAWGSPKKKRRVVLVTGAAGGIGVEFARYAAKRYRLRLMVHDAGKAEAKRLGRYGKVVEGELADLEGLKRLFAGVDTVVHLAGEPSPEAVWRELREANIEGVYNAMVAAKAAGCRRVVYASSIHAVSGYPADGQVRTSEPVNPGDLYGVTKCFGEALGRYMAEREGLSVIALRIGAFQPKARARERDALRMMSYFVSHRDLCQLIGRCVDDERLQFAIFHGVSENHFKRLDISDARELVGYAPEDDFARENPKLRKLRLRQKENGGTRKKGRRSGLREEL